MKSIVFIVPYFGKLPGYFNEWAFTAGNLESQNIDFLLITDAEIGFNLRSNIHVIAMTFSEFHARVQRSFEFRIALERPYKICDFKPALGYIFQDEISKYDYWGNCDIDQVWGNVRKFISDEILEKYDRIQFLGHFILYRNCKHINEAFVLPGAIYDYQRVFSDSMHYSFCEHSGMLRIIERNNISNYIALNYADISPRYTRLIVSRQKNYMYQILYWENGSVIRTYLDDSGRLGTDEYMYFHFQRKNPKTLGCWKEDRTPIRIIYNAEAFVEGDETQVTASYIRGHSDFKSHEVDRIESYIYLIEKLKQLAASPLRKKGLWVRQKIATYCAVRDNRYFDRGYRNSNAKE